MLSINIFHFISHCIFFIFYISLLSSNTELVVSSIGVSNSYNPTFHRFVLGNKMHLVTDVVIVAYCLFGYGELWMLLMSATEINCCPPVVFRYELLLVSIGMSIDHG